MCFAMEINMGKYVSDQSLAEGYVELRICLGLNFIISELIERRCLCKIIKLSGQRSLMLPEIRVDGM